MTCKLPFWATNAWRKPLLGFFILIIVSQFGTAQTPYGWFVTPRPQFLDANGSPLAGGKLFSYNNGTSVPAPTYHLDTLGSITPNTNPIILDAAGSAEIRLGPQSYKFVLTDSNGVQIWQVDSVYDLGQLLFGQAVLLNPSGGATQTVTGPLGASYFIQNTPHFTSPGVRVGILDPLTILDTTNFPELLTVPPSGAGQTYAIPDPQSFNSTFVMSPGPPSWNFTTAYALNTSILPHANNPCDFLFTATTAGTSGLTLPIFSTTPCGSSPATIADGTVVWTAEGAYPNTNVLDCTKAGLTCLRTAYIYLEGGGCNNLTSALGWDTFGLNSPVPICVTGLNIQKGVMALPAAATRVQESSHATAAATTNLIPYPAATTAGDLLEVECFVDTSRTISSVSDGTNSYTRAKASTNGTGDLEIWYFNGNSTSMPAATNLTVTLSASGNSACNWHEYSGIATSGALDVTASNAGVITGVTTGTTSGTAQNTELVLAAVGALTAPTFTGQAGWTMHAITPQSTNLVVTSEGLVQQATAAQQGNFTMVGTGTWSAAIATFKVTVAGPITAQRAVVLPQFFLPNQPVNANAKWQVPLVPVGNGTIPTIALSGAIVCTVDGSTDDPTFNTAVTATPIVPASSANTLTSTTLGPLLDTGCAAGNLMHFQLQRQRYNAGDTYEGFVYINGVALSFGVSQ